MPKVSKIYVGDQLAWPKKEEVVFDYDFTTTNPGNDLIGYQASYGFTQISGSGLRTYNVSSNDMRGRAHKQIGENLDGKIVTMDGTWSAQFGSVRTGLGFGFGKVNTTTTSNESGVRAHIDLGLETSSSGYDTYNAPFINNGTTTTGNLIRGYGRTIATSGTHTIRLVTVWNFINYTTKTELYKNGALFSTQNYTLTSAEKATMQSMIGASDYYKARFSRGFRNVTIYMKSWKVTVNSGGRGTMEPQDPDEPENPGFDD